MAPVSREKNVGQYGRSGSLKRKLGDVNSGLSSWLGFFFCILSTFPRPFL